MYSRVHLNYGIYNAKSHGPTFGGGYDLFFGNGGRGCYSKPGYTYQLPSGYSWDSPATNALLALLAGKRYFQPDEYEVYYEEDQ